MIKVKVVGASGYGGVGIIELLLSHPETRIVTLISVQDVGKRISDVYPHLAGFCDDVIVGMDDLKAREPVDMVFFSTPDGVGMNHAAEDLTAGSRVIDYSGDFRFNTPEAYADYATRMGRDTKHTAPELLPKAVYGLAELHREKLNKKTKLVGNPGCFAVSAILGLAPAAKNHLVDFSSIICDCKTGISGAGKKLQAAFHYPARYDHMNAYKLGGHQHVCEVERELSLLASHDVKVTFTAQVVPMCRGIMSCLYGTLEPGQNAASVTEAYCEFYKDSPFVRICDRNSGVGTVHVRGTNFCNLMVDVDARTNRLRVVSHIDNLMKGQAGNAMQNMNLIFGLPETMGLDRPGQYP